MPCRQSALTARAACIARKRLATAIAIAAALAGANEKTARGEGPDASSAFDYGLAEMLAGRYATACPALESSFRLDPRPGTLFTLADCDRKWGKTASALARFDEYLALYERMPADQRAKQKERAGAATTERATLERTVPLLAVRLPPDAPAGTRIWRDDVELTGSALSAAIPVDPGEHRLRVALPDGRTKEQPIAIEGGEQRTLVVDLPSELTKPSPATPPPATPPVPSPASPTPPSSSPEFSPAHVSHAGWTYAAAGVTVASGVVGAITGGIALSQKSIASPVCNLQGICSTEQGVNAGNEAHTMADVETGALVVAGVALVATLVLLWTEPRAGTHGAAGAWRPSGAGLVW